MFYKEYLLLLLICSAILTGCNSEDKSFVRRNKPRLDAKISNLEQAVISFGRREGDLEAFESSQQAKSLIRELDELEKEYTINFMKAEYLGIEKEIYLIEDDGHNEVRENQERIASLLAPLLEIVAARIDYHSHFITFFKTPIKGRDIDWFGLTHDGFYLRKNTIEAVKILKVRFSDDRQTINVEKFLDIAIEAAKYSRNWRERYAKFEEWK